MILSPAVDPWNDFGHAIKYRDTNNLCFKQTRMFVSGDIAAIRSIKCSSDSSCYMQTVQN